MVCTEFKNAYEEAMASIRHSPPKSNEVKVKILKEMRGRRNFCYTHL